MGNQHRKGILDEAASYITKDRNSAYGEPEDNFGVIADFWNAHLGNRLCGDRLTATDVALMMAGMKLARLSHDPTNRDSWVDGVGYLGCGGGIQAQSAEVAQLQGENIGPLITAGPFTGWREAGYTTDETSFVHPADLVGEANVRDMVNSWVHRVGWVPGDKANNDEVRERIAAKGWISQNRCGKVGDHSAHPYGRSSSGAVLQDPQGGQWCDGYVTSGHQRESDIDVVKRVADKHAVRAVEPNWSARSGG